MSDNLYKYASSLSVAMLKRHCNRLGCKIFSEKLTKSELVEIYVQLVKHSPTRA